MPGNVGVTSEFSVPDTSAGRLDKLQMPSQSFFRCSRRVQWRKVESFPLLPSWCPSPSLHFRELGMLLRAVFQGNILLGNVSFNIFKIEGHQIIWSVVSPWTILLPCLQGEAEMDWYWAPGIANSRHPTSFSCAEYRGALWVARISL